MPVIKPHELKELILGTSEHAILDVREQGAFSEGHLLFAINLPLSRLELQIGDLVPRKQTPIVLIDNPDEDAFAERAAEKLAQLGYADVQRLQDGNGGWSAAGEELFTGVNVPSKAFGEFIEHTYDTPRLEAAEVKALMDDGRDMVVVDSRPYPEYHRMNIPGGTDMPGAELVYRIHDHAPDPDTLVVVNCAGRTRSIIGAQSLINAGIPNEVVALKDGTMGWHLAGFELERGSNRTAEPPSSAGLNKALEAAARVATRFNVQSVDEVMVETWIADGGRTTYLLDVRSPEEFNEGHLPGYRNAPGGQLVQATDEFVAVRNARLVLADDVGVRATMTASWLLQLGWDEVYVLSGGHKSTGSTQTKDSFELAQASLSPAELAANLKDFTVIDLAPSPQYERAHIPGAAWTVRARLHAALEGCAEDKAIVISSPDDQLTSLALQDVGAFTAQPVYGLVGGTDAWIAEGFETESGLTRTHGPLDDVWYKPYDHKENQEAFMRGYLTWEVALVEQIKRDGSTRFREF